MAGTAAEVAVTPAPCRRSQARARRAGRRGAPRRGRGRRARASTRPRAPHRTRRGPPERKAPAPTPGSGRRMESSQREGGDRHRSGERSEPGVARVPAPLPVQARALHDERREQEERHGLHHHARDTGQGPLLVDDGATERAGPQHDQHERGAEAGLRRGRCPSSRPPAPGTAPPVGGQLGWLRHPATSSSRRLPPRSRAGRGRARRRSTGRRGRGQHAR